jgi:hypothetical protein
LKGQRLARSAKFDTSLSLRSIFTETRPPTFAMKELSKILAELPRKTHNEDVIDEPEYVSVSGHAAFRFSQFNSSISDTMRFSNRSSLKA